MDAPKGRYRVVEKDGRLVVIDNETGSPLPSSIAPPPTVRPGRSAAAPAGPVAPAGPGPLDRAADFLLTLVVKQWDSEGRAVIAWESGERGKGSRWDARLDEAQQRRMGRALLALCAAPVFGLFFIFGDGAASGFGALLTLPFVLWGAFALMRLRAETDDPSLRG
jgi:hypothetical protein